MTMKNKKTLELHQVLPSADKRLANKVMRAMHAGKMTPQTKKNTSRCINRSAHSERKENNGSRHANAHTAFFKEKHHEEKTKGKPFTQIGKDLGKQWSLSSSEEKQKHRQIATKTRKKEEKQEKEEQ